MAQLGERLSERVAVKKDRVVADGYSLAPHADADLLDPGHALQRPAQAPRTIAALEAVVFDEFEPCDSHYRGRLVSPWSMPGMPCMPPIIPRPDPAAS